MMTSVNTTTMRVSKAIASRLKVLALVEQVSMSDLLDRLIGDRLPKSIYVEVNGKAVDVAYTPVETVYTRGKSSLQRRKSASTPVSAP